MIIFDCDGVLAETEWLFAQSDSDVLALSGVMVSPQHLMTQYAGVLYEDMVADLVCRYPSLTSEIVEKMRLKARQRLKGGVEAIHDIQAVVQAVKGLKCVASNSSLEHVYLVLDHIGLRSAFEGAVFSAYMVDRPKPYPDLHVHCARVSQVSVSECMVIEDSVTGIRAAKEAGMMAVGLVATKHVQAGAVDKLFAAGADQVVTQTAALIPIISCWEQHNTAKPI